MTWMLARDFLLQWAELPSELAQELIEYLSQLQLDACALEAGRLAGKSGIISDEEERKRREGID